MADGTVLIFGVGERMGRRRQLYAVTLPAKVAGSVVALQAKRKDLRPLQQPCIHAAMRNMARTAAINSNGSMFKNEGPALIDMALHAGFLVLEGVRHHAGSGAHAVGRSICAVWIMAIRTLHEAFVYPMLHRHRELCTHIRVAPITKIGLWLGQQLLRRRRLVHRMAV